MQLFTWKWVPAQDKQGAGSTSHMVLHLYLPKSRRKKSSPPSKVHLVTSSCSGEAWGAAAVCDFLSLSLPGCSLDCPDPGEISPRAGSAKGFGIMTPPGMPAAPTWQHQPTLPSPHCEHLYGASVLSQNSFFSGDLQVWENLTKPSKTHPQ